MRILLATAALLLIAGFAVGQHDHDGHDDAYFDSGSSDDGSDWLAPGESFEFTFDIASGSFDYHCHPHPWMEGAVVVEHASHDDEGAMGESMDDGMAMEPTVHEVRIVEGNATDIDTWVYEPATVTIQLGDTVRWINDGAMGHTVTATDGEPHAHEHDSPGFGAVALVAALAAGAVVARRLR